MKTAMDNPGGNFNRADKLKQFIDNPKAFNGGREWTDVEKKELNQAESDYNDIQSAKNSITTNLGKVELLFGQKSQESTKLSEDASNIESKLEEINKHLSEYNEKLELLNGNNKTDEETEWESQAHQQIIKLKSEQTGLESLLTEIQSLQLDLNKAEQTITKELEDLLGEGGPSPKDSSGPQSAQAINSEMAAIKYNVVRLSDSIKGIYANASTLFSTPIQ